MPKLMKIGQRRRHMEQRAVLGQRRHARDEAVLEGRREAVVVPGRFAHAVAVDLDATPLRPGKNSASLTSFLPPLLRILLRWE